MKVFLFLSFLSISIPSFAAEDQFVKAVIHKNKEKARSLIMKENADLDVLLTLSIAYLQADLVTLICEKGIDVNAYSGKNSYLRLACESWEVNNHFFPNRWNPQEEIIPTLLYFGAQTDRETETFWDQTAKLKTPLIILQALHQIFPDKEDAPNQKIRRLIESFLAPLAVRRSLTLELTKGNPQF